MAKKAVRAKRPIFQASTARHMRKTAGFTLLEVMMVLAIIGGLLAMVSLTGDDRKAEDETTRLAQRIATLFMAYRQEAVFQNLELGVAFDPEGLYLLQCQDIRSQEAQANKDQSELNALKKNPWQPYSGSLLNMLELPEEVLLTLKIEGIEVDLTPSALAKDDELKPVLNFLSADEYTPFEMQLQHDADESFSAHITGDGFNPPRVKVEHYEL